MKVGLLGGTFDPPHLGHLALAQGVLETCELDEVWFMPSHRPPHKNGSDITENHHRVEMVQRAIEGNPKFKVTLIEFERNGRSFTIDTIEILKANYPDIDFHFIIGGDMIEDLPNWHRIDELSKMISFIGVNRPGYHPDKEQYEVSLIDVPQIDLSSSEIRRDLSFGKSGRYLLPESVRILIEEKGLYESN
ncbi:nicotinate-nucleotide adenylyltransferase [Guptibacillus hwajinpoensis]|uniref:Probable nicotinate-nucleotide adenylyltransferase n=2 Tax=Guptibacillus hwajinpoensis TaxID=208199 RepID=A0ABU0JZ96_9BACL|nr:nicotinate-nucleotide adenylyltransferase [Alkalihalobacillus hemicentroti]MDQ0481556.1 nicotinate-nucleotide adenylyltransferase [Alkalihalobacillus hemicentroti]